MGVWGNGECKNAENQKLMVTIKLFAAAVLVAGVPSDPVLVDLAKLGASGDFAIQVTSDHPVSLTYKASADDTVTATPRDVNGGGKLCDHSGGTLLYWPDIMPAAKIWIYATAPDGGAGATVSAILNVH